jgi:hypothetical protein
MTALEACKQLAKEITEMKKTAVKNGITKVTYVNGLGQTRNEYYHSCRWNDRPATIRDYRRK